MTPLKDRWLEKARELWGRLSLSLMWMDGDVQKIADALAVARREGWDARGEADADLIHERLIGYGHDKREARVHSDCLRHTPYDGDSGGGLGEDLKNATVGEGEGG